jgi:leader peptidase (prepilin peptidase)/N-methyltransferase
MERVRVLSTSAVTAAAMGIFGYLYSGLMLAAWCWLITTGVCLALIDLKYQRLPHSLIVAMAAGGLLAFGAAAVTREGYVPLLRAISAAVATLTVAVCIALSMPGHLGGGDVKLLAVLALYLGWRSWSDVVFGVAVGMVLTGAAMAALRLIGRGHRGMRVPAGPTLILGALVVIAVDLSEGTGGER